MKPFLHPLGTLGLLAALPLLLPACNKESHAGTTTTTKTGTDTASMMDKAKTAAADFQKSASESLATVDQKIAQLKTKASAATDSAKDELDETLASLDEKRKALGNRLSELKSEAPEKVQAMMDKIKIELADLKKATEDAVARFK